MLATIGRLPNFTHLRYFLAVAECLSFREAATRLHVAQPAVTRAIQLLEEELGYRLLERTTRRVALTPAGAHLFTEATHALVGLATAVRDAKLYHLGTAGELRVGYAGIAAAFASTASARFRDRCPDARLVMYMRTSEECSALLEAGHFDVSFILTAACRNAFKHRVVKRDRFVVLMAKDHPLAQRDALLLTDLAECDFVLGGLSRLKILATLVHEVCTKAGFLPKVAEEANDTAILMQLVAKGRGITLYGSEITGNLPPGIVALPLLDEAATFEISLAWSERLETPLIQKYVETVAYDEN